MSGSDNADDDIQKLREQRKAEIMNEIGKKEIPG